MRKRTNKNIPAKGRLREMADRLWSLAVRKAWLWECAVCRRGGCESHHLLPRQCEATRYDIWNGIALCPSCHKFDKDISPHQNATGWIAWLEEFHPVLVVYCMRNHRAKFTGTKNAPYYCDVLRSLRPRVDEEDFRKIVGVKFADWLSNNGSSCRETLK